MIVQVAKVHSHARQRKTILRVGDACFDSDLSEPLPFDILEQEIPRLIIRDKDIHETVVIKVGDRDTHALPNELGDASLPRHVSESAVTIIVIEKVWQTRVKRRRAREPFSVIPTDFRSHKRPIQIICDKKIKQSVIVVVEPSCTDRPKFLSVTVNAGYAGLFSDVSECTVAVVVIEDIAIYPGQVEVGPAVIVEVGRSDSHAISLSLQASTVRYIRKRAVSIVPVKPVVESGIVLFQARNLSAVREENVQESIVVEIEESNSAESRVD